MSVYTLFASATIPIILPWYVYYRVLFLSLFSRISNAVAAPLTRLMITAMAEPRFESSESRHCSWLARDHLENSFPPYY